ncbi:putative F-box only protein 3-like [Apostichopus japonicus]|uniref:Putative F-box only protein 3-like n=1 Tax=Stichopus japonicus TaxID=307972 RepID=A0A2G8JXD6_STIJA|nr:putative F-box only protein 3-like [Apostichopus japonicus]
MTVNDSTDLYFNRISQFRLRGYIKATQKYRKIGVKIAKVQVDILRLKEKSQSSWRVNFMEWFRDMGQYIHVYVPIRRLWNRILPCIQEKSPVIYRTLQAPPTTEEMLNEIERRLTEPLPLEFRCSYRICNGQQLKGLSERDTQFGLLGTLSVYHYTVCEVLLSAESILAKLNETENESNVVDFTDSYRYLTMDNVFQRDWPNG